MEHSDIGVTLKVYIHIEFDDAEEELKKWKSFERHRQKLKRIMRNRCLRRCSRLFDIKDA